MIELPLATGFTRFRRDAGQRECHGLQGMIVKREGSEGRDPNHLVENGSGNYIE